MTTPGRWARLELPWGASLDILLPETFDLLASHVLQAGEYFPPHFELALELVPPGGVILDLGAHLGTFALPAAASGRRVIAVEASPRNVGFLRKSARANRLDRELTVVPVAVGNRSGTVRFRHEGAWGQVTDSGWAADAVEVAARTGTEILADVGVGHVDLVKLDVEGSETAVIEGMAPLLRAGDAPVVVFESNAHTLRMFDATPEQLIGELAAFGYDNYLVGERELMPVTAASFQPDTCVDYLAIKGAFDPPPQWKLRRPRTENELARVVVAESCLNIVDARAQVARSLERAPARLLARRDVQLALTALCLDPDETVARAAAWWASRDAGRVPRSLAGAQHGLRQLGDQGRALRDRLEQIRIRWGSRP